MFVCSCAVIPLRVVGRRGEGVWCLSPQRFVNRANATPAQTLSPGHGRRACIAALATDGQRKRSHVTRTPHPASTLPPRSLGRYLGCAIVRVEHHFLALARIAATN